MKLNMVLGLLVSGLFMNVAQAESYVESMECDATYGEADAYLGGLDALINEQYSTKTKGTRVVTVVNPYTTKYETDAKVYKNSKLIKEYKAVKVTIQMFHTGGYKESSVIEGVSTDFKTGETGPYSYSLNSTYRFESSDTSVLIKEERDGRAQFLEGKTTEVKGADTSYVVYDSPNEKSVCTFTKVK